MSYCAMVQVVNDPKWYGNGLRFATVHEADGAGRDLFGRWMAVVDMKVEDSSDPVTHMFESGRSVPIE